MASEDSKQDYYSSYGYPADPSVSNAGFIYDFGTTEFGAQPQFGNFDYDKSKANTSFSQSSPTYYSGLSYSGSILMPSPKRSASYSSNSSPDEFEDEPPLLDELGINFDHILQKTIAVLNPFKEPNASILQETDLAGPLMFCLTFGAFLLLSGKVHFNYIYGIGVLGCLAMFALLNLMSESGVSIGCTISVLGYCLLPMVVLSGASVLSLEGTVAAIFSVLAVMWCSLSASKLFVTALAMDHQQPLVAYPCALLYGVFALLTIF